MGIRNNGKTTMVHLGAGDVYMTSCDERPHGGTRHYVYLKPTEPGEIGEAEKIGRNSLLNDGDIPNMDDVVIIESDDPDAIRMLIDTLVEYESALREASA